MNPALSITARAAEVGLTLPPPRHPAANYAPWVLSGGHLLISGQISANVDGDAIVGALGRELCLQSGMAAARLCGLNLLAQMVDALQDDLGRIEQVIKITGYVQADETFTDLSQVMDGCSDLLTSVLGSQGRSTRSSVGVYRLPRNHAVEVDAVVALR